jgi:hypothetical protein
MNWLGFLSPDEGKGEDSARRDPRTTPGVPRDAEGHVRDFMSRFAEWLREAAATFNQSAADRLEVDVRRSGERVEWIRLCFNGSGYLFTSVGKGTIQVERFTPAGRTPCALLRPRLNGSGILSGWREQQLFEGGQTIRRGDDELCEHYLLHMMRSRLIASS